MRSHPLQKDRNRFGQSKEMDTQTPKAASNKASALRAAGHGYQSPTSDVLVAENSIERSTSTWHRPLPSREGPFLEERTPAQHDVPSPTQGKRACHFTYPPPPTSSIRPEIPQCSDFPEELAQLIISLHEHDKSPTKGEDLAEAFREALNLPPITKQSLSELDIQNIIANVKLRHDVNFDRDLSFRPNLDGAKGEAKTKAADRYWVALEAELELYARLFQGTPCPPRRDGPHWTGLTNHAKRRIPLMFQTIKDILKSLVPERDHSRVDEHLDVPMLMQEIERGVCDLVRLAEWMAVLLKEHCAPMRDEWVEAMVTSTKHGVTKQNLGIIVRGLRELLGILETMKLDVANHQIRNLKTLLIEDTINFEKRHHLDQLVNCRSRVNLNTAQAWYTGAMWEFAEQYPNRTIDTSHVRLEIFVHAVIAQFFNKNGRHEFPPTFYLDHDRLRTIKAEIEDLIHIEVCMDAFVVLLRQLGYEGSVSPSLGQRLHSSLLAIMGDAMGYGSSQWVKNCDALSLELLRQASLVAGQDVPFTHENLSGANDLLLRMFYDSFTTHNPRLEGILLHRVLACVDRNTNSSPMALFNNLVPLACSASSQPTNFLLHSTDTSTSFHTLDSEIAQWQDIANRITHIILLHWRVWEQIAYIHEDAPVHSTSLGVDASTTPTPSGHSVQPLQRQSPEQDPQVITSMKTGEPPESGQGSQAARQTSR